MHLLDRIRAAFMSAQVISKSELLQRLTDAEDNLALARTELEEEEQIAVATGVSGSIDELTLARIDKKLAEKRARVARWSDQVRRLETALQVALERDDAEHEAAQRAVVDQDLRERERICAELDANSTRRGELLHELHAANMRTFESIGMLSRGPTAIPAMMTGAMSRIVGLRLYSFAGELCLMGAPHISTYEAGQLPTLAQRAAEERASIMSQLAPRPMPDPPQEAA